MSNELLCFSCSLIGSLIGSKLAEASVLASSRTMRATGSGLRTSVRSATWANMPQCARSEREHNQVEPKWLHISIIARRLGCPMQQDMDISRAPPRLGTVPLAAQTSTSKLAMMFPDTCLSSASPRVFNAPPGARQCSTFLRCSQLDHLCGGIPNHVWKHMLQMKSFPFRSFRYQEQHWHLEEKPFRKVGVKLLCLLLQNPHRKMTYLPALKKTTVWKGKSELIPEKRTKIAKKEHIFMVRGRTTSTKRFKTSGSHVTPSPVEEINRLTCRISCVVPWSQDSFDSDGPTLSQPSCKPFQLSRLHAR